MSAFDNEKYLKAQKESILGRVKTMASRVYLEFGGKLIGDFHAARVLPGYDPNVKIRLLQELSDSADIIVCIHAADIQSGRRRADLGITYDKDAMRLIDDLRGRGVSVTAVVITRFNGEPAALEFQARLERHGIAVFLHKGIHGYPGDIDHVVSEDGFGANPYVPVTRPLVVVTGPGPNSGKMGTCLSQMYHENRLGREAHYAKFETFPVWNLPLMHPVNIAYEAATANLNDMNAIDSYHFEAYGKTVVNYNRDLQAFPLLRAVLNRLNGNRCPYKSPTDMGVNCIAQGIVDDKAVQEAANLEIARRFFQAKADCQLGRGAKETLDRIREIAAKAGIDPQERAVVKAANQAAESARNTRGKGSKDIYCGAAIRLPDGTVITGKNSPLMHAASSMVLNAVKRLAGVPDRLHLLLPDILESVANFKDSLGSVRQPGLDVGETLITLVVSANSNPLAQTALQCLQQLQRCDVHLTHIPSPGDEAGLRRLGCSVTYDPVAPTKNLFQ
ncbi:MAG: DUF1846 domain-containing protein [Victivallales bacterium]|nr:DUF1846 domain-containing protein [Victivallales bacterium]